MFFQHTRGSFLVKITLLQQEAPTEPRTISTTQFGQSASVTCVMFNYPRRFEPWATTTEQQG